MSFAYSLMVRSEENIPLPAVDMMDILVHAAESLYTSSTFSCTRVNSHVLLKFESLRALVPALAGLAEFLTVGKNSMGTPSTK